MQPRHRRRTSSDALTTAKLEAIRQSASTRLRPILMTSAATIFGHMPLCFVSGPGAEARNSIGLVLVGGMAIGTVFTLFVVPTLYMLIAKTHQVGERSSDPVLVASGAGLSPAATR